NALNSGQDTTATFAVDTTPPVATLTLTPNILWPPNHKLVSVHANLTLTDASTTSPTATLVSITSNEPDVSAGTGNFPNDIQGATLGTDDRDFLLRSERDGLGSGRVYTVTYLVRDALGNGRVVAGYVVVPHDQDNAQQFLSSLPNPTPPGLSSLQTSSITQI